MENKKPTISERINARLKEPPNAIFKDGKWRFWYVMVFGLSLASAIATWIIFPGAVGSLAFSMGALLLWVFAGTLHYSDSNDPRLARGVSMLDSVSLLFVIAHFCFVMWVLGHVGVLRQAEARYDVAVTEYNAKAQALSKDNIEIAKSAERISENGVKAERLKNDTAYQQRKAVERGGRIAAPRAVSASGVAPSLSTATIELEKPEKPLESSAAFLSRWDSWIRAANFGELILAAITLIYIRNRSAKFNSSRQNAQIEPLEARGEVFPVATGSHRQIAPAAALRQESVKSAASVATDPRKPALDVLRGHLKVVASYLPGRWFKADLMPGGVRIRLCERRMGIERTVKKTEQSNRVLDAVSDPNFRALLIAELRHQGFPIEKGGE